MCEKFGKFKQFRNGSQVKVTLGVTRRLGIVVRRGIAASEAGVLQLPLSESEDYDFKNCHFGCSCT